MNSSTAAENSSLYRLVPQKSFYRNSGQKMCNWMITYVAITCDVFMVLNGLHHYITWNVNNKISSQKLHQDVKHDVNSTTAIPQQLLRKCTTGHTKSRKYNPERPKRSETVGKSINCWDYCIMLLRPFWSLRCYKVEFKAHRTVHNQSEMQPEYVEEPPLWHPPFHMPWGAIYPLTNPHGLLSSLRCGQDPSSEASHIAHQCCQE